MAPPKRGSRLIEAERGSLQARKSASTRRQIVEAALECLTEVGYTATTTTMVAERARVSRGAMLHHYPSRRDIVRAVVDHLHDKRLRAFRTAAASVPPGNGRLRRMLEGYWQQIQHPLYRVFIELSVLSRTDLELAEILAPVQRAFDREIRRLALELLPEWRGLGERFEAGFEVGMLVMDGAALSMVRHGRVPRKERLLNYLELRLQEIAGRAL